MARRCGHSAATASAVLLLALGPRVVAIEDLKRWEVSQADSARITTYGFESGASYDYELRVTSANSVADAGRYFSALGNSSTSHNGLWSVLCSDAEMNTMGGIRLTQLPPCDLRRITAKSPSPFNCRESARLTAAQTRTQRVVGSPGGHFTFFVASCGPQSGLVKGEAIYTFVNPGGKQLSSEQQPLPALYAGLVGLWCVLCALWCGNWVKYRSQNAVLQKLLTFVPFAKLLGERPAPPQPPPATQPHLAATPAPGDSTGTGTRSPEPEWSLAGVVLQWLYYSMAASSGSCVCARPRAAPALHRTRPNHRQNKKTGVSMRAFKRFPCTWIERRRLTRCCPRPHR